MLKWAGFAVALLILINVVIGLSLAKIKSVSFEPKTEIYKKGLLLKLGPAVFMLSHGSWEEKDYIIRHVTSLNNRDVSTDSLIYNLKAAGAKYIWMSACHAGDYDFMVFDRITGKKILWPKGISRAKPGSIIIPVFLGLWIGRLSFGEIEYINDSEVKFETVVLNFYPDPEHYQAGDSADISKEIIWIKQELEKWVVEAATKNQDKQYQWPDRITFTKSKYTVQEVSFSEISENKTVNFEIIGKKFNKQSIYLKTKGWVIYLEAKGWKRGKSYPIIIKVYPLIKN